MAAALVDCLLADGSRADLRLADGLVAEVLPAGSLDDGLDVGGRLVLEAPAEPHAHLDKALTADLVPNSAGDLQGAIEAWRGRYHERTVDEIAGRARAAAERLLAHGTTTVRTHVDCGEGIGTTAVEALVRVGEKMADRLDLELVGLVACPLTGPDGAGNRAALAAALSTGVEVVGGCPHLDPDPSGLIDIVLSAATEAGLPVDLHVDETLDPSMRSLRTLAAAVRDRGFPHMVTASHCVSLGMQPADLQAEMAEEVAAAGIAVVTLPQTNLFLQARQRVEAPPRGLTAISALVDAGVVVAAGADNMQDPFCTVGRGDPLETAALCVMAGHRTAEEAYRHVSADVRSAMGRPPAGPEPGAVADLLILPAGSVREAVASAPPARLVLRAGRIVSETVVTTTGPRA